MKLAVRGEPQVFACHQPDYVHSRAIFCTRRRLLGAFAGLGAAALLADRPAGAQAPDKPFRIDVHHHLSSPGFIAEISGRRTGQVPLMKWTVAQSLEDMDQGGVATSILSNSEPSVFFGNFDAARKLARETNEFGAKLIGLSGEFSRGVEIAKEHTGLAVGQYRGRHPALIHILERLCDGPLHQGHLPRSSTADFGDESR